MGAESQVMFIQVRMDWILDAHSMLPCSNCWICLACYFLTRLSLHLNSSLMISGPTHQKGLIRTQREYVGTGSLLMMKDMNGCDRERELIL